MINLLIGEFAGVDSCESVAKIALPDYKLKIPDCTDCNADYYFCGKNCVVEADFGSVFISEFRCVEKRSGLRVKK